MSDILEASQEAHQREFLKKKTLFIQQLNNDAGLQILRLIYEMTKYGKFHDDLNMPNEQMRSLMAKQSIWAEIRKYLSAEMLSQVEHHLEPKAQIIDKKPLPQTHEHPYLRMRKEKQ